MNPLRYTFNDWERLLLGTVNRLGAGGESPASSLQLRHRRGGATPPLRRDRRLSPPPFPSGRFPSDASSLPNGSSVRRGAYRGRFQGPIGMGVRPPSSKPAAPAASRRDGDHRIRRSPQRSGRRPPIPREWQIRSGIEASTPPPGGYRSNPNDFFC